MLGRYRESDKSNEEKGFKEIPNLCNSVTSDNLGDATRDSTEKMGICKEVKVIAEEEEESDEDLSYLL